MSESKHTKGPWYAIGGEVFKDLGDVAGLVATCEDWSEDTEANARLIAAAPELLELCKRFSAMYGHLWDSADKPGCGWLSMDSVKKYDAIHADMAAVIKKATAT